MHSQSACFIWFRGSSEYVCIFLLISAYICACFFLNFSLFHFSFSPFSDRFFPFTLVVFFWIYLFVLSNGIHAIFVSFALSSFPISRGIDGCIRSQILSHCIRFSYLDLFFLCLLIFFFLCLHITMLSCWFCFPPNFCFSSTQRTPKKMPCLRLFHFTKLV